MNETLKRGLSLLSPDLQSRLQRKSDEGMSDEMLYELIGECIANPKFANFDETQIGVKRSYFNRFREQLTEKNNVTHQEIEMKKSEYKCRRCQSNATYFYSRQTRSADEPATLYIMCTKCGYQRRE